MTIVRDDMGDTVETENHRAFRFIKMIDVRNMLVWEKIKPKEYGFREEVCKGIEVKSIDINCLKELKVWDTLTPEVQKEVESVPLVEKEAILNRMEKARASRKAKYPGVPKELICKVCYKHKPIQPRLIVKKVEEMVANGKVINVEDYCKEWTCRECGGSRRRVNLEFTDLPKTMKCKCGKVVPVNVTSLKKKAEREKTTVEKIIAEYKCSACSGFKLGRGRAANPEFKGLPKTLKCKCGKEVALNPSILSKKAKRLGVTVQKLIEEYKCQTCKPTKGRRKGIKR